MGLPTSFPNEKCFFSTDVFPEELCKRQLYLKERETGALMTMREVDKWSFCLFSQHGLLRLVQTLDIKRWRRPRVQHWATFRAVWVRCRIPPPPPPQPHFSQNLFRVAGQGPSQGVIGFDFVTHPDPTEHLSSEWTCMWCLWKPLMALNGNLFNGDGLKSLKRSPGRKFWF